VYYFSYGSSTGNEKFTKIGILHNSSNLGSFEKTDKKEIAKRIETKLPGKNTFCIYFSLLSVLYYI